MKGITEKLTSIILIIVMLLAQAMPIAKALDTGLENQGIDTTSKEVKFDAYFKTEEGEKIHKKESNLAEKDTLYLYVKVEEGYQDETKIKVENPNFKIEGVKAGGEWVESIDGSIITLNKIRQEEIEIALEISSKVDGSEIPSNYFSKETKITIEGVHVKGNSREENFQKNILIQKTWEGDGKIALEQGIVKYIKEENETILVQKIKLGLEENALPIEKETLEISVPKINKTVPQKIYIQGSTLETTGEEDNIKEANWNEKDGIIKIEIANIVKEDKIKWFKEGKDEYYITYIYKEEKEEKEETTEENVTAQEEIQVTLNTKAQIVAYSNTRKEYKEENKKEGTLKEQIGKVVTLNVKEQNEVNKGYLYTKVENPKYTEKVEIEVASDTIKEEIEIEEKTPTYQSLKEKQGEEEILEEKEANIKYVKTKISKENFQKMLGEEGEIQILDEEGSVIARITKETEEKEGIYEVEYEASKITIKTSAPKTVGKIKLENTKEIKENLSEEEIKALRKITNTAKLANEEEIKGEVNLQESTHKIESKISSKNLSTAVRNENIEIRIALKTLAEQDKLYKNPKIEIQFPENIEVLEFNEAVKLLFTDELKIKTGTYNPQTKKIEIELEGEQTKYNDVEVALGPTIALNVNVILNKDTKEGKDKIEVKVIESEEVIQKDLEIKYIVPETKEEPKKEQIEDIDNPEIAPQTDTQPASQTEEPAENPEPTQEPQVKPEEPVQEPVPQVTPEANLRAAELQNVTIKLESDVKDGDEIKEGSTINYKASLVNLGDNILRNAVFSVPVPTGTTLREYVVGNAYTKDTIEEKEDQAVTKEIENLEPNTPYYIEMQVIVNKIEGEQNQIEGKATLNVEGFDTLTSNKITNPVKEGALSIDIFTAYYKDITYKKDSEVQIIAYVKNIKPTAVNNVVVECEIPESLEYDSAEFGFFADNYLEENEITYDEENHKVTWKLATLEAESQKAFILTTKAKNGFNEINVQMSANCREVEEKVISNKLTRYIESPRLEVHYFTDVTKENVDVGDNINYYIEIKNTGLADAQNVEVKFEMPEGRFVDSTLSYRTSIIEKENSLIESETQTFKTFTIHPDDTLLITINTTVAALQEGDKGTINLPTKVEVTALDIDKIETNQIVHKIKVTSQEEDPEEKKIDISGVAWLDKSRDGIKDSDEEILKNIEVYLITKEDATQVAKVKTDKKGEYTFKNVEKGEYIIVFKFDTSKYEITKYKLEDMNSAVTSKAALVQKTILKDGTEVEGAVTDVIKVNTSNIYNINLGIAQKGIFDLSLEKKIRKITVQGANGIKTYDYTGKEKSLAKIEIPSKEVNQTLVIIEYVLQITNEGTVVGYANEIADYMPKDLKFTSELNKNWYKGTDGLIYTKELEGIEIQPGETKEIKLILTKETSDKTLGTTNNSAEITKSSNNYGIEELDSVAGNKKVSEDDYSQADLLITLNTGTIVMYISLSISMITLLGVGAYIIKKHVLENN